jgi:hypothetical protein
LKNSSLFLAEHFKTQFYILLCFAVDGKAGRK